MKNKHASRKLASDEDTRQKKSVYIIGMLAFFIFVFTLLVYTPALKNDFIWDDDYYVTNNPTLRDLNGLKRIWFDIGSVPQYYPLVHTSFWVEYHLWQLNPFGYHLVNVLLHALNAVLLLFVLRLLRIPGAWLAAAVFALHPVHVESVAWITERKNVLSGCFYLSSVMVYIRFLRLDVCLSSPTSHSTTLAIGKYNWGLYTLAMVLYLCALLSKTVTCSMPAAILLLIWWKREHISRHSIFPLIPYFLLGAVFSLITVWMEKTRVGAVGEAWALSFVDRCLIAGRALWFYAGKLLWPNKLIFIYHRWHIDAGIFWQYLFPSAAVAVVVGLWIFRSRIGKAPLVAVLFFAGTLSPALGFFDVYPMRYSFVADHFQYLASIGLIVLCVAVTTSVFQRLGTLHRNIGFAAYGVILIFLGTLVWRQCHNYKDQETLWRDTIVKNPGAWMAHNNLGLVYANKGMVDEAISEYNQAIIVNPTFAEAHNNLGNTYCNRGTLDEAISEYKKALAIIPNFAEAHNNLGNAYCNRGALDEAIFEYKKALAISSSFAEAHNNLGFVYAKKGMVNEAISEYKKALAIKPNFAEAHNNLGFVHAKKGMVNEAISSFKKAIAINPDYAEAYNNLGKIYSMQGRLDKAISNFKKAIAINLDHANAYNNLGKVYSMQGRLDKAISNFKKAIAINLDHANAYNNLGVAYGSKNMLEESIFHFKKAITINPDYADAYNNLGVVYGKKNMLEESIFHFKKAITINPDYADAYNNLSLSYYNKGDYKSAILHCDKALELEGNVNLKLFELLKPYRKINKIK